MRHKDVMLKIKRNDINLRIRAYEIIVTEGVFHQRQHYSADAFRHWANSKLICADHYYNQRYENCTPKHVRHCQMVMESFITELEPIVVRANEILDASIPVPVPRDDVRQYSIQYYLPSVQLKDEWTKLCDQIQRIIDYYGDAI